nr:hypothetical protein [Tanacetum cinerariifolium]
PDFSFQQFHSHCWSHATVISTGSEVGPTASPIVTSYSRRKGKEVMVESDTPKKHRLQEQIDAQVSREQEEQQEREDMRMNEQIARDAELVRIHVEEDLQGMIYRLDKSNETIVKYLQEYQDFAFQLPLEKRIALISDLVEDFILMGSKEEAERLKRKGLNLEQEHGRIVGNKMHKAFPLLVRKFPLPEGTSHCQKMNATVRRIEMPLIEVCTAIEEKKKKLPVKDRWQLH